PTCQVSAVLSDASLNAPDQDLKQQPHRETGAAVVSFAQHRPISGVRQGNRPHAARHPSK
ncbi:hypothetical protein, partial [Thalassospira lucentensis]|uniref:hypothetical protein n=1 Tax=Thalassospira lucentensis TaxID=168935 RepID=UPI001C37DBE5